MVSAFFFYDIPLFVDRCTTKKIRNIQGIREPFYGYEKIFFQLQGRFDSQVSVGALVIDVDGNRLIHNHPPFDINIYYT